MNRVESRTESIKKLKELCMWIFCIFWGLGAIAALPVFFTGVSLRNHDNVCPENSTYFANDKCIYDNNTLTDVSHTHMYYTVYIPLVISGEVLMGVFLGLPLLCVFCIYFTWCGYFP